MRRYVKSGKSGSGRSGGLSSLVHLARSTSQMLPVLYVLLGLSRFPVFRFELEPMKTTEKGFFGP